MTHDEKWLLEEKYDGKETPEYETDRKRLVSHEPLGYIIGWQPFLGLRIYLDSKPLIPRPETEWWTDQLIQNTRNAQACPIEERTERDGVSQSNFSAEKYAVPKTGMPVRFKFLDLCAGSGAIGCAALAKLLRAQIYFGEIEPAHKQTIQKNIRENNLDASRADVRIGDLFEPFGDMRFDIIAMNPPYIPTDRILPASVSSYEPANALYSGTDGLDVIRRVATDLSKYLTENGIAWIECDSAQAETACALFRAQNLLAEIHADQYGVPRIIVVSFPFPSKPNTTSV